MGPLWPSDNNDDDDDDIDDKDDDVPVLSQFVCVGARRWEHPKMYSPELYPCPSIQSRPAARSAVEGLVMMGMMVMALIA